ncbi:RNA exonuclease [Martiniozyma asiatica (nom. inval.)]|nr:RNA exonuclease [Martiniozyma asiatica]
MTMLTMLKKPAIETLTHLEAMPITQRPVSLTPNIFKHREIVNLNPIKNKERVIRISSYNILSRHYVWPQLYSYLPLNFTNWKQRKERLDSQIEELSQVSDLLCFQEMEYQIYKNHWEGMMNKLGFSSIFSKKQKPGYWKKSANMMDGVGLFYRNELFELINYEQIDLAQQFKNGWVEDTTDTKERLINRNTVAVIAVLKHRKTDEIIFISNTHLYWNPSHDDVKLMQSYLLTKLIHRSIKRYYGVNHDEIPINKRPKIIMVGDFNSEPSSMVYKFMSEGHINTHQDSRWCQNYGSGFASGDEIKNDIGSFSSPYKKMYEAGKFSKTTFTPKFKGIIDYMWFSDGVGTNFVGEENGMKFTKVLGDIDANYLQNYQGFPNAEFPSDHIPILVELEL